MLARLLALPGQVLLYGLNLPVLLVVVVLVHLARAAEGARVAPSPRGSAAVPDPA
jgi:hypothetical protein